jgi:hypothetical protein
MEVTITAPFGDNLDFPVVNLPASAASSPDAVVRFLVDWLVQA